MELLHVVLIVTLQNKAFPRIAVWATWRWAIKFVTVERLAAGVGCLRLRTSRASDSVCRTEPAFESWVQRYGLTSQVISRI